MSSPYWVKSLIKKTFFTRFFLSKLTHYRPIGRIVDQMLFKNDDIIYLPKDQVIKIDESIEAPESVAAPSQVVEHFIKRANTRWIMNFCICRYSNQCKNYPIELGCIFLGDAARDINPKFGRLATVEEALDHARRCREAGLVHMIGRNKLDTVWLNIGPSQRLMTICNCCPCCCLWKVLPVITPTISGKIHRMPGIHMEVTEKCVGCGTCTKEGVCFVDAIRLEGERAVIDQNECRGCGRCAAVCPKDAIRVVIENDAFIENAIRRISNDVDVT
ncbi:MAG: 4Fe-4S binding protein [Desulfobacterales bacterium]|nr:4Fe-4S binding protein [Desulfobacterales bacterium]